MKHPRAIWIALLAIVAIARSAGAASVDWSEAFVLQARGAGLDPVMLVGFDPQPDPPGEFGARFGLTLAFKELSDVQVLFSVLPADGPPLAFTQVPEPSALALLGLGVAVCAASRGRSARR